MEFTLNILIKIATVGFIAYLFYVLYQQRQRKINSQLIPNKRKCTPCRKPIYMETFDNIPSSKMLTPANDAELANIVITLNKNKQKFTVIGNLHSERSLTDFDIVISPYNFNKYTFTKDGIVTVGGSICMEQLQRFLDKYHYGLPVSPRGVSAPGYGPTVAGFITAGGITDKSNKFGGFWENVERIKMVTGDGLTKEFNKKSPEFPHLFANYGLLGIITEADLNIVSEQNVSPKYPLGVTGNLYPPEANSMAHYNVMESEHNIHWINCLVLCRTVDPVKKLTDYLQTLYTKYILIPDNVSPMTIKQSQNITQYSIPFKKFYPTLLYPYQETMYGVEIIQDGKYMNAAKLNDMGNEIYDYVTTNGYFLYLQTMNWIDKDKSKQYYTKNNMLSSFLDMKKQFNPNSLLNTDFLS